MPYSIRTKDGIVINNIPDDVPRDSEDLKRRVAEARAQRDAGATEKPEQESTQNGGIMSDVQRALGEFGQATGKTARAMIEGAASVPALVVDPAVALMNQFTDQQGMGLVPAVSDLLTKAGLPKPETPAERITSQAIQAGTGAGVYAKLATLASQYGPGAVSEALKQFAAQPTQQITSASAAATAAQSAQEAELSPEAQLAASIGGALAGAKLGPNIPEVPRLGAIPGPAKSDAAKRVIEAAKRENIPVLTSDVNSPQTFAAKWLRSSGEKIPVAGTGPVRAQQQQQRINAVQNVARDFGAGDVAALSDDVAKDLLKTRGAFINKYTTMKNQVINRLSDSGQVPVANASREIDAQISQLETLKDAGANAVAERLRDFKNSIEGQNLKNIEVLRRQLGESLKDPSLASIRGLGEKSASSVYGALRQDMGDFIKRQGKPGDLEAWETANAKLAEGIGELKNSALKAALSKGDITPEAAKSLLFSSKPSDVRALMRNLSPGGKSAARMAIVSDIVDKSGGLENIRPDRFAKEVEKNAKRIGIALPEGDAKRLQGLAEVLRTTSRATAAGEMPATGAQLALPVGAAVLADLLGSGGAAVGVGASLGVAARIYESKPVRDLLVRAADAKSQKEIDQIAKRLINVIQAQKTKAEETE